VEAPGTFSTKMKQVVQTISSFGVAKVKRGSRALPSDMAAPAPGDPHPINPATRRGSWSLHQPKWGALAGSMAAEDADADPANGSQFVRPSTGNRAPVEAPGTFSTKMKQVVQTMATPTLSRVTPQNPSARPSATRSRSSWPCYATASQLCGVSCRSCGWLSCCSRPGLTSGITSSS
jgi:hypothetical protein